VEALYKDFVEHGAMSDEEYSGSFKRYFGIELT
jgi:hypothetical protein